MNTLKKIVAGVILMAACLVVVMAAREGAHPPKYYALEPETKVRPARFEDMKYHPEPELRAPASKGP